MDINKTQTQSSWIPDTPVKQGSTNRQPISTPGNWLNLNLPPQPTQEDTRNDLVSGNSVCFQGEIQAWNEGDSCNLNNFIQERNDHQGIAVEDNEFVCRDKAHVYYDFCNEGLMQLTNAAASAARVQGIVHTESSSFASSSNHLVELAPFQAESSVSSLATEKSLLPELEHRGGNILGTDEYLYGQSFPFSLSHQAIEGVVLSAGLSLYHPAHVTSNPTNTVDKEKGSHKPDFTVGEAARESAECEAHNKIVDDSSKLQTNNQSEQVDHISCATASKTVMENHEPDVGCDQRIDPKTPRQKPKRKKHRPKVIFDRQSKSTPKTTNPARSEKSVSAKRKDARKNIVSPPRNTAAKGSTGRDAGAGDTPKRKYSKRKGVDQETKTTPEEDVAGTTSPKTIEPTRRSCRRSLNFGFNVQEPGEISSCQPFSALGAKSDSQISNVEDQMISKMKLGEGVDVMMERTEAGQTCDLLETREEKFEGCPLIEGIKSPGPSTPVKFDQLNSKSMAGIATGHLKGKCQIIFSNATHDKEPSFMNTMTTNTLCATRTLNKSNCGSIFSQDKPARGTKRGPVSCTDASESCSIAVDFPAICKKRRTRRVPNKHAFTSVSGFETMLVHCNAGSGQSSASSIDNILFNLKQVRNKRSKGLTRPRDLASLHGCLPMTNPSTSTLASQENTTAEGPQTCWEALVSLLPSILTKKQRSKRHLLGFAAAMTSKSLPSIDDIVEQFSHLDIAAESNALVAYNHKHPRASDLVYRNGWNMVSFDFSDDHIRRRRARPKVELDDETTKVWKLLLEDINKEGIDGTDEEKRKWWQEERRVFRGRVNSFIAKMRLVQGDRRFSPWKGSVVDSVVGVFLTQNVSDHLSSSAFISMAARFPLNPSTSQESCCEGLFEKTCLLQLGNTGDEDYAAVQYVKNIGSNTNSHAFFRNPCEDIKSTGNLECPSSGSSGCGPSMLTEINFSQFDTLNGKQVIQLDEDQKSLDEVLSSQTSITSPFLDLGGQIGNENQLHPHSSLGEESNSKCCLDTSFLDLLQMQEHVVVGSNWGNKGLGNTETVKHAIDYPSSSCLNVNSVDADPWNFKQLLNSSFPSSFRENEHLAAEESGLSEESAAGLAYQNTLNLRRSFTCSEGTSDTSGRTSIMHETVNPEAEAVNNLVERANEVDPRTTKPKMGKNGKQKQSEVDWDSLRRKAQAKGKRDRTASTMDSVDWEAVRCAEVEEIAQTIKERGMNNMLAERIKDFLNRLVREHGSIDLEWLRDVPPDEAKEYLLSIRGLGLKSVECVRLLTLHHVAFPVDTNVGRIAVRLGWVPLQPLPESLQLHLLEMYPVLESIQKYLWPRLCRLDQRKLYELHYQMITFGKVFCTKSKPNCNACPMRGDCRHFASAYASSRLALPAPEERSIVTATEPRKDYTSQPENIHNLQLLEPERTQQKGAPSLLTLLQPRIEVPATPKPIIEEPQTPEPEPIIEEPETPDLEPAFEEPELTQFPVDIEDTFLENDDELPIIDINLEALNQNVQNFIQNNVALQGSETSKALVVVHPEAASIPQPKLKNISRLRTEHQVYLLPDSHELLKGLDKREQNDPSPYLLAIWAPGETINSIQPPERRCSLRESGQLCHEDTCFSCNSMREATSQTVRGTLLIPCRTAMQGSFPLNGTYFQVNEVFADHETSLNPINVPRDWLWNLRRRTVYFGTSIPTIFKGLGPDEIRNCFWRGFVCVRGFDRAARAPRPLIARLHFPASKMPRNKGGAAESKWPRFMSDE